MIRREKSILKQFSAHYSSAVVFWDLFWEMTIKELKLRYKNTTLGFLWVIVYPIFQAIIISFVFRFIYTIADSNYQHSLFLNLLLWNFFSSSWDNATQSVVQNRTIIKKARFSYIVIPLSIVFCNGIILMIPIVLFGCYITIFRITSSINIFYSFIALMLLLLFTGSISLVSSALNVKRRDASFLVRAFLMVWFYLTPVIYSISNIPTNIKILWSMNPLTEIFMLIQYSFFNTPIVFEYILPNTLLIVGSTIVGLCVFKMYEAYFDDYM